MEFAAIGVVMLAIVFVFYMRMIDARMNARKHKTPVQQLLEKAAVFESVADDASALKFINSALTEYPQNSQLLAKKQQLEMRLNGDEDS